MSYVAWALRFWLMLGGIDRPSRSAMHSLNQKAIIRLCLLPVLLNLLFKDMKRTPSTTKGLLVLALISILHAGNGRAQNLITNGSFEDPAFADALYFLQPGSTAIPGWTVVGGEIHFNNDNFITLPAAAGDQYAEITGDVGYGKGVLSDLLATTPGTIYQLSFQLGAFNFGGSYGNAAVDVAFNEVQAGTFVNFNNLTLSGTDWEKITIAYIADSPQVRIRLTGSVAGSPYGIGIDDVQFVSAGVTRQASAPGPLPILGFASFWHCARRLRRGIAENAALKYQFIG
jgi:hypothetical protein